MRWVATFQCVVATSVGAVSAQALNPWPGSIALASGYNLLRGNPRAAGADPGWSSQAVFDVNCASCFAGGSEFEGYDLPAGVAATPASFCSYNASSYVLSDGASTQAASSSLISNDADYGSLLQQVAFSASDLLQQVTTASANGYAALVLASAQCDVYDVALDAAHYAYALTANFEAGLAALPPLSLAPSVLAEYAAFVETFGTHLPSALTLGGYAAQVTSFAGAEFSSIQTSTSSVTAAASASLLFFFGASVDAGGSAAAADYAAFAAAMSDNSTICRPACPPSSPTVAVDPGQWRPTLAFGGAPGTAAPAPVSVTLVPISHALQQHALPAARAAGRIRGAHALRLEGAAADLAQFLNASFCGLTRGCGLPSATPRLAPAPLAALAAPRGGAAAGVIATGSGGSGSYLLVAGGDAACGASVAPTADVWLADLDAPANGWVRKADMPANGTAFSASRVVSPPGGAAQQLVVAGGFEPAPGDATPTARTWWADVASSAWVAGPALDTPRAGAAMVQFAGVLVLLGGWGPGGVLNTTECLPLDPSAGAVQCPAVVPPHLLGGLVGAAAVVIPSPTTPGGETLVVVGGCMAATGGAPPFGAAAPCAQASAGVSFVESLGPLSGVWQTLAPLPFALSALALYAEGPSPTSSLGALWAVGGAPDASSSGPAPSAAVFRLPLAVGAWQVVAWHDPWPVSAGAVVGPAPGGMLRVGGCASVGSGGVPLEASQRIVRFGVGA